MIALLYECYFKELLYYASRMTTQRSAAEDLVQETFMRALEHSAQLQGLDQKQCRAWLYRTVRNLFIDKIRKEAAMPLSEEKTTTEEDFTGVEVEQICGLLEAEERELFMKRYFEGYDATRLGEMYDMPPSTVRAKLAGARKKLRTAYPELNDRFMKRDKR